MKSVSICRQDPSSQDPSSHGTMKISVLRDVWEENRSVNSANLEMKLIGWLTKLKGIKSIKWLMPVRMSFTGLPLQILTKKMFLRRWILCLTKTIEFFLNVILPRFLQISLQCFSKARWIIFVLHLTGTGIALSRLPVILMCRQKGWHCLQTLNRLQRKMCVNWSRASLVNIMPLTLFLLGFWKNI